MSGGAGQMPLFGPGLDVTLPLKQAMAGALKSCRLSREQVVDRMNELLEAGGLTLRVTLPSLEKWVAPSAGHVIPVALLPAFCRATESRAPMEVLAAPLGTILAGPREQALMRLGQAQVEAKRLAQLRRRALEDLEELG